MNNLEQQIKICTADVPNGNGRIYPKHLLENLSIQHKKITGMIGMPTINSVETIDSTEIISHIVENLEVKDNELIGDCTILETHNGQILKSILNTGEFRMSGIGTLTNNIVNDDYKLISINFTTNPS